MDQFMQIVVAITPMVGTMATLGLVAKFLPVKALGYINNHLIPWVNALGAFLLAFTPAAHASIFGDVISKFGVIAQAAGSLALAGAASGFYEVFLRKPIEKLGWQKNSILLPR